MVSEFEAEEQDDEDNLAVPVPETEQKSDLPIYDYKKPKYDVFGSSNTVSFAIETNLTKLFNCMSVAYRWVNWNR